MIRKRKIYPIELLESGIKLLSSKRSEYCKPFLVYCFAMIKDKYLPLNREYKPLGLSGYDVWSDYESYDFLLLDKSMVKTEYLFNNAPDHNDRYQSYFFFSDSTTPWVSLANKNRYIRLVENAFMLK